MRVAAAALMIATIAGARPAGAQPPATATPPAGAGTPLAASPDVERARQLTEEGRKLVDSFDWTRALAKFRDAATFVESPGLRYNIAFCEENLGKLVAALADYRLAERETVREGASEVAAAAAAHIAVVEPRIASLAFRRAPGAERAAVAVDGLPVSDPGRADVDPGTHAVSASLDGVTRFKRSVTLAEGQTRTLIVSLDPLPPPPPKPPTLGYGLTIAGLSSLAVMGLFIWVGTVNCSGSVDRSGVSGCDRPTGSAHSRKVAFQSIAIGTGVAGGLALGTGLVLIATNPGGGSGHPNTAWSLRAAPGRVELTASF